MKNFVISFFQTWVARLRNANPHHHAIVRGMLTVMVFVFLGKIAGAIKEIMIAHRYGVSGDVDAYLFVFNLMSWPISVWVSVLIVVLVPMVMRIQHDAPAELSCFRSELFGLTILLGLALTFLAWMGLPLLMRTSWTGLTDRTITTAVSMIPTLGPLAFFGMLAGLFSAWVLAAGRHENTLLEAVPALVIVAALLAFPDHGLKPLVCGTLAGFAFHSVGLVLVLMWKGKIEMPRFSYHSPHWASFWQSFSILLIGQALMGSIVIMDQFFAANLGEGAIATLSYAYRILSLILSLGALAISRATLPLFTQMHIQGDTQRWAIVRRWVPLMFVGGLLIAIVGIGLAPWGVRLFFERGTFTAQNTALVAEVLRYGLTQIPFYFAAMIFVSILGSQGRYRTLAVIAGLNLIIKAVANASLVPWLGIKGIALSNTLMYMVCFVFLWLVTRVKK
jgi:peptidoglycan biosynthesis protein MviN/MurJ (putative lipid II flippase)